jgi:hypothetical protein
MTSPKKEAFKKWVEDRTRTPANTTSNVHDITRFTIVPRTSGNRRAILGLANWRKDHAAVQPGLERRKRYETRNNQELNIPS